MGAITAALLGHAREALCVARAAATYPRGIFEAPITFGRPCEDGCHDTPVILVHGYGHNRTAWMLLDRRLRRSGFTSVHTVNYNPLTADVPALARRLAERVELIRALTGRERVHVIGHSLGGVILRWFVQELGGDKVVDTAITVATPHRGTVSALVAAPLGRTAAQLLPWSPVLRRLGPSVPTASPVRWVAYWSDLDLLVQPVTSARLEGARNHHVPGHGHLSLLMSPRVVRSIVAELEAGRRPESGTPARSRPLRPAA